MLVVMGSCLLALPPGQRHQPSRVAFACSETVLRRRSVIAAICDSSQVSLASFCFAIGMTFASVCVIVSAVFASVVAVSVPFDILALLDRRLPIALTLACAERWMLWS